MPDAIPYHATLAKQLELWRFADANAAADRHGEGEGWRRKADARWARIMALAARVEVVPEGVRVADAAAVA